MTTIVTRAGKGSPLTNAELDQNFLNLNSAKLEAGDLSPYLLSATAASTYQTIAGMSSYLTTANAASTYQTILVSGTSIKTVNGQSVLGSGNIQIDGGVTSFNTRTGAVTLSSSDVTTALGFTPYNSTNPDGYITSSALSPYLLSATAASTYLALAGGTMTGAITFAAGQTWPTFNQNTTGSAATLTTGRTIGMTGDVTWTSGSFNGSANVTGTATLANSGVTAGTYTKVTVDAKGRVTSGASLASADLPTYTGTLTSSQVTTALGYTPYNSTNPNGYTSNTGTVTSVSGTGTVSGLTLSGTVTGSGSLTLGGTLTLTSGQVTTALGYTPLSNAGGTLSGGLTVNGDIYAYRAGGTTGVIYLSNSGTRYLYWDGTNYIMPGGQLDVSGQRVLNAGNYSSYALPLSGGTMSGQLTTRTTTGATPIVNGSGSNSIQVMGDGTNGAWISFHRSGAYAINMGMDTSNVFAVGGWSDGAAYRWQVDASGNFTARGNVTAYSDERLKKDWSDLPADFIERLAKVKHGTYTRIDSGERQVGISAQGLLVVLQEAVLKDGQGNLSVAYGNAALTAAVELAARVVALESRLAALEA